MEENREDDTPDYVSLTDVDVDYEAHAADLMDSLYVHEFMDSQPEADERPDKVFSSRRPL